jgi:CBS domain-containing protein
MTVKHLLQFKGDFVATIRPSASLAELLDTLAEYRIGAMVVSADGVHIDGIVSERDIVRALSSHSALRTKGPLHLDSITVAEIMTAEVRCCDPDDSIDEIMAIMTNGRMRHLPVVSDGKMLGIVSIGDIVKARISDLETERTALFDYVTNGR